jgi:hypothetical protein
MKRNIKIVLVITGLSLVGWLKVNNFSGPVRKSSNFKSYQQNFRAGSTTLQQLIEEEKKVEENTAKLKKGHDKKEPDRRIAEKNLRTNPVIKHLDQEEGNYLWSPNIFAVNGRNYKGDKKNIVGKHDGFIIVKENSQPQNSLSLIYSNTEKKLGVYMEKIVIVHEQSKGFESKLKDLTGKEPFYVSGVYFIDLSSLQEAISTVSDIQKNLKSDNVDLDVNYSYQKPN